MVSMLKKRSYTLITFLIYLLCLILLPKDFSYIGGIPIRLTLSVIFLMVAFYEIKTKKVTINKININVLTFFYSLFIISTIPSIFASYNLWTTLYTIVKFLVFYLVFLVLIKIEFHKKDYENIIRVFIFSILLKSVGGILEYFFDENLFQIGIHKYPGALGRISAGFFNTIYFGIFINLVFAFLFYFFYKEKNTHKKCFYAILSFLTFLCLLFTFTRSSFLIFCGIAFLMLIFHYRMFFNKWSISLIFLCFSASILLPGVRTLVLSSVNDAFMLFTNVDLLSNFLPGTDESDITLEDDSLEHRKEFAILANKIARNHIFTGVGFGAYIDYLNTEEFDKTYPEFTLPKTHPHSSLVLLLAETGIFAFLFFIGFVITLLAKLISNVKENYRYDEEKYSIAAITLSITIGFTFVCLLAENAIYDTQIYPIFLSITALSLNYCFRKKKAKVLFISSTGDHLTELLQLKDLFTKYEYYIVTEKTSSNLKLKEKYPGKISFVIYGTKDHPFSYVFKLLTNCFLELFIYLKFKPNVIVTTGAHTAGPMCCIGKLLGSKIIFIESFANISSKTVTGRLVYLFADVFIVQWKSMKKYYPKAIVSEGVF